MVQHKLDILLCVKAWQLEPWVEGLSQSPLVNKVHIWPTKEDLSNVDALLVWKPLDEGVVAKLPKLKWVSSLGAGVDHLVGDPQIPDHIPVTRIVDPFLARDMTNYCIMGVMLCQRSMDQHRRNQANAHWNRLPYSNLNVGVLGLGELGRHCATTLAGLGFNVSGFSRTPKQIENVQCYSGDDLPYFLSHPDILINLLPVTPQTESILDHRFFQLINDGAYIINVARGNHLVEEDLIPALDSGKISGALLDVFRQEPLPQDHPFWHHPKITITPHVASVTTPESAIQLLLTNASRLIEGKELLYEVDRRAGY